jgi:putative Mg2+ transporter-C (MgtC) family protein
MDILEVTIRISLATLAGAALGLNRDLHGKPTGVRTLGLVGLGSAVAILIVVGNDANATSRVIQGILTGIGFLGAGVIVRINNGTQINGLTTAACTWLTACIGVACGAGQWKIVIVSVPVVFLVLCFGGQFERLFHPHVNERHDS